MKKIALAILTATICLTATAQTTVNKTANEISDILENGRAAAKGRAEGSNSSGNTLKEKASQNAEQLSVQPIEIGKASDDSAQKPTTNNSETTYKKAEKEEVTLSTLEPTVAAELGLVRQELWDGVPIKLSMPVGSEQKIYMPEPGHLGLPKKRKLPIKTTAFANVVTITPSADFAPVRIIYLGELTNTSYLIDISAVTTNALPKVLNVRANVEEIAAEIKAKKAKKTTPPRVGRAGTTGRGSRLTTEADIYKMMSRYASQQHYAPRRVIKNEYGLREVSVVRKKLPLVRNNRKIEAMAHSAWKYRQGRKTYFITSVYLQNKGSEKVQLTPRILRNPIGTNGFLFSAVTFQTSSLSGKKGRPGSNATMMYLISETPIEQIMGQYVAKRAE